VLGLDPRDFVLCSYGGAGPVHAFGYAAEIGVAEVLIPLGNGASTLLLDVHVSAPFRLRRVVGGYWRAEAKAGRTVPAAAVLTTSAAGLYRFRAPTSPPAPR